MSGPRLWIVPTSEDVAEKSRLLFESAAAEAIRARGRFIVALSGGSTPKRLYELLAGRSRSTVDWPKVVIVFGDERCVPEDDEDSNYRMAQETFMLHVPLAAANVLRVLGDDGDAERAARDYDRRVGALLGDDGRIDLALMGMGPDGHTASLFPGQPDTGAGRTAVAAVAPPTSPVAARVTLTYGVFARAIGMVGLIAGTEKAAPLKTILGGGDLPFGRVLASRNGDADLVVDQAAAAQLDQPPAQGSNPKERIDDH